MYYFIIRLVPVSVIFKWIGGHQSLIYLLVPWDWSTFGWLSKYSKAHEKWEEQLQTDSCDLFKDSHTPVEKPWPSKWAVSGREEQCPGKNLPALAYSSKTSGSSASHTLPAVSCSVCYVSDSTRFMLMYPDPLSSSYLKQATNTCVPNENTLSLDLLLWFYF